MQPVLVCIWFFKKRERLGSVEVEGVEKVETFPTLPSASRLAGQALGWTCFNKRVL